MKKILSIIFAVCFFSMLNAEDLVLKNGKVYRDYKVLKKDKKGIKIRYMARKGTILYARNQFIPYEKLKPEDQTKYPVASIHYNITGIMEKMDIYLIPQVEKYIPKDFNVLSKKAYTDPESAVQYMLDLHIVLMKAYEEENEKLKREVLELLVRFPFKRILTNHQSVLKRLRSNPKGSFENLPNGEYILVAFKECYSEAGHLNWQYITKVVKIQKMKDATVTLEISDKTLPFYAFN